MEKNRKDMKFYEREIAAATYKQIFVKSDSKRFHLNHTF